MHKGSTSNLILLFILFTAVNSIAQDVDNDGILDDWEMQNGLDPTDPKDAFLDGDEDHVINLFEFQLKSDPNDSASPLVYELQEITHLEDLMVVTPPPSIIRVRGGEYDFSTTAIGIASNGLKMVQGGWSDDFETYDPSIYKTVLNVQDNASIYLAYQGTVIIDGIIFNRASQNPGSDNKFISLFEGASTDTMNYFSLSNCMFLNDSGIGSAALLFPKVNTEFTSINCLFAKNNIGIQFTNATNRSGRIINSTFGENTKSAIELSNFDDDNSAQFDFEIINSIFQLNGNTLEIFGNSSLMDTFNVELIHSNVDTAAIEISPNAAMTILELNSDNETIDALPLFMNPSLCNFCIEASSPSFQTGLDIGLPFEGVAPNMGAFFCSPSEISTSALDEASLGNTIKVFPNPFSEFTTFDFGINPSGEKRIDVFDTNGQRIRSIHTTDTVLTFDAKVLTSGVYFYRVFNQNHLSAYGKLIIRKE